MEEGKLFLSVTVLYIATIIYFFSRRSSVFQVKQLKIKPFSASYNGYERDISSISLIVDDQAVTCRHFFKSYRYRCRC